MALNTAGAEMGIDTPLYDPIQVINVGVALALILAGFLSLVYILVGGFKFIVSGGDEAKTQEAMNTIRYALVGLAVTMLAFTAVTVVGKFFGLDLLGYINFETLYATINSWTSGTEQVVQLNS